MDRRTIIIAIFTFITIEVIAQQRLTVRDSLTQEPIAYTSVWFGNVAGGYTDESGMIEIPEGTERILLSHICYETKNIAKVTTDSQTIFLFPKIITLDEVAIRVKSPKRIKTTEVDIDLFGAQLKPLSDENKRELALRYGLEVTAIKKGKLQDAGIQKGMILLQVNDKEMRTVEDFEEAVKAANQSSDRTLWIRSITPSGRRVATAIDLSDEKGKKK